jgi:hypothetical protein
MIEYVSLLTKFILSIQYVDDLQSSTYFFDENHPGLLASVVTCCKNSNGYQ